MPEIVSSIMVMNKALHHRGLPPPHPKPGEKRDKLPNVVLAPGVNKVPVNAWNEAKKLPVIQALLEDEVLEEMVPKGKKAPAKDLGDFKPAQAVKVVKETTDLDLLANWREDASGAVLKAIDDRIDELKAGPPKAK